MSCYLITYKIENATWVTEKECLRLYDRATALSFESALEKYKNLLYYNPEIIQRVSIQHIASYIGVSRETLSRIWSQIREKFL
jgi:CRP-like cAMP-binding protein